jgi:hypothetical protein
MIQLDNVIRSNLIGCGNNAQVYKDGNLSYKEYMDDCYSRIKREVFESLKDINHPNFIKLRDLYHIDDKVMGYSYDYVKSSDNLMIDMPIEYTYQNLYQLKSLLNELNKRKILIDDENYNNVIVGNDSLVIIDPDMYRIHNSEDYVRRENTSLLIGYLTTLWGEEYIKKHGIKYCKYFNYGYNLLDDYFDRYSIRDIEGDISNKLNTNTIDELISNVVKKRVP